MRDRKASKPKTTIDNKSPSCYSISNGSGGDERRIHGTLAFASPQPEEPEPKQQVRDTQKMCPDMTTLWRLWSETDRRLDRLAQSVREGVQVDEASNFSRWLRFSGILKLLEPFEQEVPVPIRASELTRKCDELIYECGEWYRLHERSFKPRDAYISQSKLAAIENDLRAIKEALRLPSQATAEADETALRVLPGGAL